MSTTDNLPPPKMAPMPAKSQFDLTEAEALLEFCIDLNNEDDRQVVPLRRINLVRADRSLNDWDCVADSRVLYAHDHPSTVPAGAFNPATNGFEPFDTAWTLWRKKPVAGAGAPVYALVFRGTVFANDHSVVEDALVTTIAAQYGVEFPTGKYLPLTFAVLPRAEVHEGFGYGLLSALFDGRYGALRTIREKVEKGSTLLISGHSQGAALATLAHAFFYYAAQEKRFGVDELDLHLRSYFFAQPKPGNYQFGLDFNGITGGGANAFTFTNTIDPVPMVPETRSYLVQAAADVRGGGAPLAIMRGINNVANRIRREISGFFEYKLAGAIKKLQRTDKDGFYLADQLRADSRTTTAGGVSQDFVAAGRIITLPGHPNGSDYYNYPKDDNDDFMQHHATTYRRLVEILYDLPQTTEASPELQVPPNQKAGREREAK